MATRHHSPSTTKDRLVRAAVELFWQRSYTAAGVDELCRNAATRKGSFYHFFRTKSDLAVAAIEFHWSVTREQVFEPIHQSAEVGLDRLRRLVELTHATQQQALAGHEGWLGCPFGNLGQEMAHQDARIRAAVQTAFEGHCAYLEAWLDQAVRARQIPQGDHAARARQVLALFEGALLLAKVAADPDLFLRICAAMPSVAGRSTIVRAASGTPPELL